MGLQFGLPWGFQRWNGAEDESRWSDTFSFSALRRAGPSSVSSSYNAPPPWIDFREACVVRNKIVFRDSRQQWQSLDLKTGRFEALFTAAGLAVFRDEDFPAGQFALRDIQQKPREFVARFALDRLRANFPWWTDGDNSISHDLEDLTDRMFATWGHLRLSETADRLTVESYDAGEWKPAGWVIGPAFASIVESNDGLFLFGLTGDRGLWFCPEFSEVWLNPEDSADGADMSAASALCPENARPYFWVELPESGPSYSVDPKLMVIDRAPLRLTLRPSDESAYKGSPNAARCESQFLLERWLPDQSYPPVYRREAAVISVQDHWAKKVSFDGPSGLGYTDGWDWHLLPKEDGKSAIVVATLWDGRVLVYELEGMDLRLILKLRGPTLERLLPQLGVLLFLAVMLPMAVLVGLASWVMRFRGRPDVDPRGATWKEASLFRRAVARAIDLIILLALPIMLTLCHVDFAGWWDDALDKFLRRYEFPPLLEPSHFRYWFDQVRFIPFDCLSSLMTAPVPTWGWLGTAGVLLFHLTAQARNGTTVGKWLLGLRTLRTTGRPCGLARSILRELLLCIDSLMLLCWLPGAISIVLTSRSQRLGDLAADTVVVRQ